MLRVYLLTICAFLTFTLSVNAQVTISPTNLFIEGNTRFGSYIVVNGSSEQQEISVDFLFAYTDVDDSGNRVIVYDDSVSEDKYSIASYIRAFPKNFVLAPGQRQVVRLRVSPPQGLDDGTYWARIKTTSAPETPPIELGAADAVTARVGIKIEQVTGIFYKQGTVDTGVGVQGIRTNLSDDGNTLSVLADIVRTGNSPFLGSITTSLTNSAGEVVRSEFVSTSLYFDKIYKQDLLIEGLPAGTYSLSVKFETDRSDISGNNLIQMEPVTETTTYVIR